MPRVKFVCIQSFSSEDPDHPAKSLLSNEITKRTWLCKSGEPKCSVVIQLEHSVVISSVQIGVHHAAFVEVLVGRSENPDDYKVLIPSCVFVTPTDSRRGEGESRVRSFAGEQLAAARAERWDRLKVLCSQPYNTRCKYGLSFIDVFTPEERETQYTAPVAPAVPAAPGPAGPAVPAAPAPAAPARLFNIDPQSSSDEDTFKPGELFAKHRLSTGSQSTEVQIRQATSQVFKNLPESSSKLVKTPICKDKQKKQARAPSPSRETREQRQREDLLYNDDDDKPNTKIDKVIKRHEEEKKKNETKTEADRTNREKIKPETSGRSNHEKERKQTNDDRIKDESRKEKIKPETSKRSNHEKERNQTNDNKIRDENRKEKAKDSSDRNERVNAHSSRSKEAANIRDSTSHSDTKHRNSRESKKRQHSDDRSADNCPKRLRAGPRSSSPHSLLADVTFALSGYAHPRRAAVRSAALALGARLERDWSDACTHLICAFPNTPKLRAVRASPAGARAVAVTGEWAEACLRERRRLPWQWFATEPHLRVARDDDGETEVDDGDMNDCDTDDEIEKVLQQQKKDNAPSQSPNKEQNMSQSSNASDVEYVKDERFKGSVTLSDSDGGATDEDAVVSVKVKIDSGKALPNFFDGFTFVLHDSVAATFDVALLTRYVRAYGGEVLEPKVIDEDTTVNYVLTCDLKGAAHYAAATAVRPDWVWRCHDKRKLCSHKNYSLE